MQWIKDSLFNKLCWKNQIATRKIMKLDFILISYTEIKIDQRLE